MPSRSMLRKKANNAQKDKTPLLEVNISWMKFIEKMKKLVQYTNLTCRSQRIANKENVCAGLSEQR